MTFTSTFNTGCGIFPLSLQQRHLCLWLPVRPGIKGGSARIPSKASFTIRLGERLPDIAMTTSILHTLCKLLAVLCLSALAEAQFPPNFDSQFFGAGAALKKINSYLGDICSVSLSLSSRVLPPGRWSIDYWWQWDLYHSLCAQPLSLSGSLH